MLSIKPGPYKRPADGASGPNKAAKIQHPVLTKAENLKVHSSIVYGCEISPNGKYLGTCSLDGTIRVTELDSQKLIYTADCDDNVLDVAWSSDSTRLVGSTEGGRVVMVKADGSHADIFQTSSTLEACAFGAKGHIAVGGKTSIVYLLEPTSRNPMPASLSGFENCIQSLAFSPDGNLLAVGCVAGHLYIFGLKGHDWIKLKQTKYHTYGINSLCFSPSGRLLLATGLDRKVSIWNVPQNHRFADQPRMTLIGHEKQVTGGAFLDDDEQYVVTGSYDKTLCVWNVTSGRLMAMHPTFKVYAMSCHAPSATIAIGASQGKTVDLWRYSMDGAGQGAALPALFGATVTAGAIVAKAAASVPAPPPPPPPLPSNPCLRKRMFEAEGEVAAIQGKMQATGDGLRAKMTLEQELIKEIAELQVKLASSKRALKNLQTPEFLSQSRELVVMEERTLQLLGAINECRQSLDSLTDCLEVTGLEQLTGPTFREWLCDIGLGHLSDTLSDINGSVLCMFNVDELMGKGVSFADAADLQLRGFIAHNHLGPAPRFDPPANTVLSWTTEQTAAWIASLDAGVAPLVTAGWNGAALCSLTPTRVIEASKGKLSASDAVKFLTLVKATRRELDGGKDEWVARWSGSLPIVV